MVLDRGLPAIEGLDLLGRLRRRGVPDAGAGADGATARSPTGSRGWTRARGLPGQAVRRRRAARATCAHCCRRHDPVPADAPADRRPASSTARRARRGHRRRRARRFGRCSGAGVRGCSARAGRPADAGASAGPSCSDGVFADADGTGDGRHLRLLPAPQARPGRGAHRARPRLPDGPARERPSRRPCGRCDPPPRASLHSRRRRPWRSSSSAPWCSRSSLREQAGEGDAALPRAVSDLDDVAGQPGVHVLAAARGRHGDGAARAPADGSRSASTSPPSVRAAGRSTDR